MMAAEHQDFADQGKAETKMPPTSIPTAFEQAMKKSFQGTARFDWA